MANLDDGSISLDQFDFCSMSTVLPPDSSAVYNEVEAYYYNPDQPGLWSGPFVYFDESMSWDENFSWFYISVWESELDVSIFNEECHQNLCDDNICEEAEFCIENWKNDTKTYLCCAADSDGTISDSCHDPAHTQEVIDTLITIQETDWDYVIIEFEIGEHHGTQKTTYTRM